MEQPRAEYRTYRVVAYIRVERKVRQSEGIVRAVAWKALEDLTPIGYSARVSLCELEPDSPMEDKHAAS
jgi:hypothetical protein